ncbi:MAG: TetR/AcrR family transcriptional regulator [Streptosporangiaceae bacterium]
MNDDAPAPTGLARRGRRLSDEQTRQRMLQAAVAMVNRTGLTVSLDHISFEDVIREAGVSRSAVYRHWPYKDLFVSDLVKTLATSPSPEIVTDEVAMIRAVVGGHPDWLGTPEGRHALVAELLRRLSLVDFRGMYQSPQWRTYIALHATFLSLADGQLRDEVQAALARSEQARLSRIASAWELLAGLFGYRLRPELATSYPTLAALLTATMRGLFLMALPMPDLAAHQAAAQPFGAAEQAEWSLPAIGLASIASAFLEPDPAVEWDEQRIAAVREALLTVDLPDA